MQHGADRFHAMPRRRTAVRRAIAVGATAAMLAACVQVQSPAVRELPTNRSRAVSSPVKVHLIDGSVVVFPRGARIGRDYIFGLDVQEPNAYDLTRQTRTLATEVALDSVVAVENFYNETDVPVSIALSSIAAAGTVVGAIGLYLAIFGSCPTVYAVADSGFVLEAESFSYSIAPLFEARDVDLLGVRPDSSGHVMLEIRNEAAETHYMNHLELLEVRHGPAEHAVPDSRGQPLIIDALTAPAHASDRVGRDVRADLMHRDGLPYRTSAVVLGAVTADDTRDFIDLAFAVSEASDSAAVILDVRNSLLTTILLYDVMLARQGAGALDWLGRDLQEIGTALELGRWYADEMGLRVHVRGSDGFREVAWIRDVGPIAWERLAVMIPVLEPDTVRVRLSFVADSWRIDRVGLAPVARRGSANPIPAHRIADRDDRTRADARRMIAEPDHHYLITSPGDFYRVSFRPAPTDSARTFMLAAQGYYVEWIRRSWLTPPSPVAFTPSPARIVEAVTHWREVRDDMQERFDATRFAVR